MIYGKPWKTSVRSNKNPGPSQPPNIQNRVHIFKTHFSKVHINIYPEIYFTMTKPNNNLFETSERRKIKPWSTAGSQMSCPHVPEMWEAEGVGALVVAKSIHDNRSPEGSTRPYRESATTVRTHNYQCSEKCNTSPMLGRSYAHIVRPSCCISKGLPRPLYRSVAEAEASGDWNSAITRAIPASSTFKYLCQDTA